MRRKPNPDQRRRELCDAAIALLADDGAKGVSHLKVDRKAGVPDGTTSFYFRTRSALLHAVATRVAEQDLDELAGATAQPAGLATLVIRSAKGARLTRTKARNELALLASRDPELAAALRESSALFLGLIRDAVLQRQPPGAAPNPARVDTQAYAVMMFISGVMQALATGERKITSADELDSLISGIVHGVGETAPVRSETVPGSALHQ